MLFQQGCRSAAGDEYADMTVMHGDVYSKPGDKSSGERGERKDPVFKPNSVQHGETAKVYMNERGQFIY